MITKGILKTINYNENSCTVRIPLFETASSSNEVVLPAVFLTQPGNYNGYSEGDIVFIDFENNSLNNPIILGKLYLGAAKEKATAKKGGLAVADLNVTSNASLPLDTKLVFDMTDTTLVPVEGSFSTYKSLLDIIKALYKTETSINKTAEESLENITKIKVEYLSQPLSAPEPTKEDPNWDIVMPSYQDGYGIWQKTTCYNSRDQILNTEIICFSSISATTSCWLSCSTRIHNGNQQKPTERLEIVAMIKLGANVETVDTDAVLEYRWANGTEKTPKETSEIDGYTAYPYKLIFENTDANPIPNENLIITAKRNGVAYEAETIVYAPLNTPILVLTNESAALEYDSYGQTKLTENVAKSTATLILNNSEVADASYSWDLKNTCSVKTDTGTNTSTIEIAEINKEVDVAIAECTATYTNNKGETEYITRSFSILKAKQGKSLYKIDIYNDFVSLAADYEGNIDSGAWAQTNHRISAFYGDEPIEFTCSMDSPDADSEENLFHLKYTKSMVEIGEDGKAPDSEEKVNTCTAEITSLTGTTGNIIYELYRGTTKVASSKFEVVRLDAGAPGADATMHWLAPSTTNIKLLESGFTPNTLNIRIIEKTGNSIPTAVGLTSQNNLKLKVTVDNQSANSKEYNSENKIDESGLNLSINATEPSALNPTTQIFIELYNGNTLIDQETISVVKDGENGANVILQNAYIAVQDLPTQMPGLPALPDSALSEKKASEFTTAGQWYSFSDRAEPGSVMPEGWKICYRTKRTGTEINGNEDWGSWETPSIYCFKDDGTAKAYERLSVAAGLFGFDDQGIYYAHMEDNLVLEDIDGKKYAKGNPIPAQAAARLSNTAAGEDKIKLFINSELLKTKAIYVTDSGNKPLFSADVDSHEVSIGKFKITEDGLKSIGQKDTISTDSVNKFNILTLPSFQIADNLSSPQAALTIVATDAEKASGNYRYYNREALADYEIFAVKYNDEKVHSPKTNLRLVSDSENFFINNSWGSSYNNAQKKPTTLKPDSNFDYWYSNTTDVPYTDDELGPGTVRISVTQIRFNQAAINAAIKELDPTEKLSINNNNVRISFSLQLGIHSTLNWGNAGGTASSTQSNQAYFDKVISTIPLDASYSKGGDSQWKWQKKDQNGNLIWETIKYNGEDVYWPERDYQSEYRMKFIKSDTGDITTQFFQIKKDGQELAEDEIIQLGTGIHGMAVGPYCCGDSSQLETVNYTDVKPTDMIYIIHIHTQPTKVTNTETTVINTSYTDSAGNLCTSSKTISSNTEELFPVRAIAGTSLNLQLYTNVLEIGNKLTVKSDGEVIADQISVLDKLEASKEASICGFNFNQNILDAPAINITSSTVGIPAFKSLVIGKSLDRPYIGQGLAISSTPPEELNSNSPSSGEEPEWNTLATTSGKINLCSRKNDANKVNLKITAAKEGTISVAYNTIMGKIASIVESDRLITTAGNNNDKGIIREVVDGSPAAGLESAHVLGGSYIKEFYTDVTFIFTRNDTNTDGNTDAVTFSYKYFFNNSTNGLTAYASFPEGINTISVTHRYTSKSYYPEFTKLVGTEGTIDAEEKNKKAIAKYAYNQGTVAYNPKVHIEGTTGGHSWGFIISNSTANATALSLLDEGQTLDIDGSTVSTANYLSSDSRLKTNIKYLNSSTNSDAFYKSLKPVEFEFNKSLGVKRFGFIAQDIAQSVDSYLPNQNYSLVTQYSKDSMYSVDYNSIIALNTAQILKLSAELQELYKKYNELVTKVEQLSKG